MGKTDTESHPWPELLAMDGCCEGRFTSLQGCSPREATHAPVCGPAPVHIQAMSGLTFKGRTKETGKRDHPETAHITVLPLLLLRWVVESAQGQLLLSSPWNELGCFACGGPIQKGRPSGDCPHLSAWVLATLCLLSENSKRAWTELLISKSWPTYTHQEARWDRERYRTWTH